MTYSIPHQSPTRLLIVDDHTVLRECLRNLFTGTAGFEVVGEADNGCDAIVLAKSTCVDMVLIDISMPVLNGLEAARQILSQNSTLKVIIFTGYQNDRFIEQSLQLGVSGYLLKHCSQLDLQEALKLIKGGHKVYSPAIEQRIKSLQNTMIKHNGSSHLNKFILSAREAQVIQLIAEGQANKQIAARLDISIKTVEKHRQHIMEKLNIHDTAGLTRYAIYAGLIGNEVFLSTAESNALI